MCVLSFLPGRFLCFRFLFVCFLYAILLSSGAFFLCECTYACMFGFCSSFCILAHQKSQYLVVVRGLK